MVIKLLVLDCDGILLDSRKPIVQALRDALKSRGYRLSKRVLKELGNGPIEDVFASVGVRKDDIEEVAKRFEEGKVKRMDMVKAAPWVSVLKGVKVPKIGLTNNLSPIIRKQLRGVGIGFVHEVLGAERGESKVVRFRQILKQQGVRADEVVYVDDKPAGVALARKIGCVSVLVPGPAAWASREEALRAGADFVVQDLRGVVKIVRELD